MKIGIMGHGFVGWGGGVDFIRHIVMCLLASNRRSSNEIIVLVPWNEKEQGKPGFVDEFANDFGPMTRVALIESTGSGFMEALRQYEIDVLIPSLHALPKDFHVPWVGYLYDFQHRYFSHLFTPQECERRNGDFESMLASAKTVVVNSDTVAQDARRFYPNAMSRIVTLPFFAAPNQDWFAPNDDIARRYHITKRYFIICNQFWVHKDHWTAFLAFSKITTDYPDVDVVCTGATSDHRMPNYMKLLKDGLLTLGLASRVHILGHIPKADQISLVKNALAVVQPTGFEGGPGGGSVYDAVALGVPAIVSNIPVNKELSEPNIRFFDIGNAESLAAMMRRHLEEPSGELPDRSVLVANGDARRQRCGNVLMGAIDSVMAGSQTAVQAARA